MSVILLTNEFVINIKQVLLHDPNEVPLVKDIGFAVAPGTHTLVAIRRKVTHRLEPLYGSCYRDAQPRSVCISQCIADKIWIAHSCRDVYMPQPVRDEDGRFRSGKRRFITVLH